MSVLLDNTLKVSLILAVALGAGCFLRGRSAALRHWVLAVAICCAAAFPLLGLIAPSWRIAIGAASGSSQVSQTSSVVTTTFIQPQTSDDPTPAGAETSDIHRPIELTIAGLVGAIWAAGAALSFLILLVGLMRLTWLSSRARPIDCGRWVEPAAEIGPRVLLLQSDHPTLLVAWGLARPKVLLPAAARHWSAERARIVLGHELAHIRRGDWIVHMVGEVLRSVYWFNPLVWISCRRLREESERACDDAVLTGGVDGAAYASHLLAVARALNAERRIRVPAVTMARRSSLEGRICAMLNARLNRTPLTVTARSATLVALLGLAIPIAGFSAQRFSTLSGSVVDETNRVVPDVTLTLTDSATRAKHEVRTNPTGHFEFVGLPGGEYALEVRQTGFSTFTDTVTISGRDVDRSIKLNVGSLQETITVSGMAGQTSAVPPPARRQEIRARAREVLQRALERCDSGNSGQVGGNILAPRKLVDVRPEYPELLKNTNVGGVVTMEAVIGTDGSVQDVRVLSSPHPDLDRAAVEAVRLWEFTSTLLNCVPIEVRMHVTANFVVQH